MSAVERAAEVMADAFDDPYGDWRPRCGAEALADADLLVTDEMRAVLDVLASFDTIVNQRLREAFNAYLASRQQP